MSDPSARIRGTTTSIDNAAKQLRKTLTPAEQQLWQALRGGKLAGLKFRRQHPVGNFILDFYCAAHKLFPKPMQEKIRNLDHTLS